MLLRPLSVWARMRTARFVRNALTRYDAAMAMEATRWRPRLDARDIEALRDYQKYEVDNSWQRRSQDQITDAELETPTRMHAEVASLVRGLVTQHGLKSVVNVGGRVDVICACLAPRLPEVSFTSIDIQENLEEHNSLLPKSPNWERVVGYALDLFEDGLRADLVFMTSTACLFSPAELESYLEAMEAPFLVLNEPIGPPMLGPAEMPYVSSNKPLNPAGPLFWVHDYKSLLERHGYAVEAWRGKTRWQPLMVKAQRRRAN